MDLKFKSAHLMSLGSAMVSLPKITEKIRRWKVIISLSRYRERVGVRVGLELYPPHLYPLP